MAGEQPTDEDKVREQWQQILLEGHPMSKLERRLLRLAPSSPRCGLCLAPFRGVGGKVLGLVGYAPSRKNPRFCNACFERAPHGGAEVDAGILFADVRGFTSFSESRAPEEVARLLNRLYALASDVLAQRDAVIDKLVGDQVMAIFVPGFAGKEYLTKMVAAGEALLRGVGYARGREPWLPLGVGLDHGMAFVGNVGEGDVKDFTAIGDVVNTAARLQAEARAGQMVISERLFRDVGAPYAQARPVELNLKGKSERVAARVVDFATVPAPS